MKLSSALFFFVAVASALVPVSVSAEEPFSFTPPTLVQDSVMPSRARVALSAAWVRAAFAGEPFRVPLSPGEAMIVVDRQDYSRLRFNETCLGKPFEFPGGLLLTKGLGSHAHSRLRVILPEPAASFHAQLGIALNAGGGSVRGSVEVDGKSVGSEVEARYGREPAPVDVVFEEPVSEFTLVLDDAGDGVSFDQGNWLEPVATTPDGRTYDLTEAVVSRFSQELPFSFRLDGVSSREFLDSWNFSEERVDDFNDVFSWTDPKTGLTVSAEARRFERFDAVDWTLRFTNGGNEDSPLIEDVLVVDSEFQYGFENSALTIHTLNGDSCSENSWLPVVHELSPGESKDYAPVGGRSSNGTFPFWNVASRRYSAADEAEGFFFAVGWSGQWHASFSNAKESVSTVTIRAGQETLAARLHSGETIRTPRALLLPWRGDLLAAHALFRRLLMFEYVPKVEGAPVRLEFLGQCFDRYYRKRPGWEKVDSQIESAKLVKAIGGTSYWFDAAWFPIGFPNGVGNWFSDKELFPNGVEELGDALEKLGMKFVLWFEPERVAPGTEIAEKYPQYVYDGEKGGLYKLSDPEARAFLTELLLKRIREFKVGVFRTDFNIDPLPYWRRADGPERVGIDEIRYVEGLCEMWDRIRAENPGLWIDDCASGGRRIDLETLSRSVPLWRSDTCCWPDHPEWDQNQTLGLARYLPLFSCSAWESDPYTFRSAANPGAIMQFNFLDDDYDAVRAEAALKEAQENSQFWYGDFYPLTDAMKGKGAITAWQLHRPDLDAGLVYLFRQPESPYLGIELTLRGLDPDAVYGVKVRIDSYDDETALELTGAELAAYPFTILKKGSSVLIRYEKKSR